MNRAERRRTKPDSKVVLQTVALALAWKDGLDPLDLSAEDFRIYLSEALKFAGAFAGEK